MTVKERRERTLKEILEEQDLDLAIRDRFNTERHPEVSVDGDDPWDLDPFKEEGDV